MIESIEQIQNSISKYLKWTKQFLKDDKQKKSYSKVVDLRRELKKISYALEENPSAALYGESQMGKSYLVSSLLSSKKRPFEIYNPAEDKYYNYIDTINPRGNKKESTSIVTRFTTTMEIENVDYPIKVKFLSPADIILLLCDSYFNDVKKHNYVPQVEIEKVLETLGEEYESSEYSQPYLSEDDLIDIRDYFLHHFPDKNRDLLRSEFFDKVSKIIHKVPPDDWYKFVELLWMRNEYISQMFNLLIQKLGSIGFIGECFVDFKSILRENGTLLGVARLREIFDKVTFEDVTEDKYLPSAKVYMPTDKSIRKVKKSVLCALARELVFKLDDDIRKEKKFLEETDLLDFPGARARLTNEEKQVEKEHLPQMLLRGKVAYIFNKYSQDHLINNILLCHNNGQAGPRYIPQLLNNWIRRFVGDSPEERQEFMNTTDVSPLFIVCTWFNQDLKRDPRIDKIGTDLTERWKGRFKTVIEKEIVDVDSYDWLDKWTTKQNEFKNFYMLRDYFFSSEDEDNIFLGFSRNGVEQEYNHPDDYPEFYNNLKKSFLKFPFVQDHFADPEQAWNRSATPNQDGSEYIIENLAKSKNKTSRFHKFERMVLKLSSVFEDEIHKHFHSDEADKRIVQAADKAARLHAEMDVAFRNPFFFGKFIESLLVSENEIFNFYRSRIQNLSKEEQKDYSEYHAIKLANPGLIHNKSTEAYEKNIETLCETYRFKSQKECEAYFEEKNIDLNELFFGEGLTIKKNSEILAEALEKYWIDRNLSESNIERLRMLGISPNSARDLVSNVRVNFDNLNISDTIAREIRTYVDRYDKIEMAEQMIADISAAIINSFVKSMGYEFFSADDISSLRKTSSENDLGLRFDFDNLKYESMNSEEIEELFHKMENIQDVMNQNGFNEEEIKNVPRFSHYIKWRNLMKIAFVANCDIPTYDILANNELGSIIEKYKSLKTEAA